MATKPRPGTARYLGRLLQALLEDAQMSRRELDRYEVYVGREGVGEFFVSDVQTGETWKIVPVLTKRA